MALYIGLMSGTSLDGIDAAIIDIDDQQVTIKHAIDHPIPTELKQQLLTLINNKGGDNIELLGEVDAKMGEIFAQAVNQLISSSAYSTDEIIAIGSHGQTIRHRPENKTPFTLQIGDAARISELTGITTVADFRRRDIAAGGQGAPLVPAFHRAVFSNENNQCIVNIGGMSNISYLPKDPQEQTAGFDTGPGNILLDSWCQAHTGNSFDKNGEWAKSGTLSDSLLHNTLKEPYFSQPLPKSTGREHFNLDWIQSHLDNKDIKPEDTQNTLTELTALTIINAVEKHFPDTSQLVICGGGAFNNFLNERLESLSGNMTVHDSSEFGIDPNWVEAAAFGWLAHCCLNKITANEPLVTGAHSRVVLGAIYPK